MQLIDVDYYVKDEKPIIRKWYRNGENIECIEDNTFVPYFYAWHENLDDMMKVIENMKITRDKSKIEVIKVEKCVRKILGVEKEVLKIFVQLPYHVPLFRDRLKTKYHMDLFEASVLFCLSPDTWIRLVNGNIVQLKNIQKNDEVLSNHIGNIFSRHPIVDICKTTDDAYLVETSSNKIVASKNHKFLTFENHKGIGRNNFTWKTTNNLMISDFIIQWMNYERNPIEIRSDWMYLFGFYFGDGTHYTDLRNDLTIADKDENNLKVLQNILMKYNLNSKICKRGNTYELFFNSIYCLNLKSRKVPYMSPIEDKLSFIAGIFDSEGTVANGYCRITNTDEKLIYWISSILFSLGLPNKILECEPKPPYKKRAYFLDVYNLNNFKSLIKIKSPYKITKLYTVLKNQGEIKSNSTPRFDRLPIVNLLKSFACYGGLEGKGWKRNRIYFKTMDETTEFHKNLKFPSKLKDLKRSVSRAQGAEIYNEIKRNSLKTGYSWKIIDKHINYILNHVFFAKVRKITPIENTELIDISINKTHNYIANNFASHNSTRYAIDNKLKFFETE